jgi:site-specific DNA-methyltransferase (adenine-specific)
MLTPYYEQDGITIYHGDCREILPFLDVVVDAIVTDPPYSSGGMYRSDRAVPTANKYQISHETNRTYEAFAGDNRDQRSFEKWVDSWASQCLALVEPGGGIGVFIDWRNVACVIDAIQVAGWVYRGLTPWHKGSDLRPNKGWFRRNVEFIVWGSAGPLPTGAGVDGECWDGLFVARVNDGNKQHQTGKPESLLTQMLSVRPEWRRYIDPFMGSGTMLVAAKRLGLEAIGIEIDERNCEIAAKRCAQGSLFTPASEDQPTQQSILEAS